MPEIVSRRIEANGILFSIGEAGEGDKLALFLHGFPESRRCWRHQLPLLAALGWRAVAVDMRGYGQSSRPDGRGAYRIGRLVEDAVALFDALDARQRVLVGHDWGGLVAWAVAIRRACPLDGLIILNAPHPAVYKDVIGRSWRQRLRLWYVLFFALPWVPEKILAAHHARRIGEALRNTASGSHVFPPDILAHYRDNAAQPGALTAMLDYYRANLKLNSMTEGPGVAAPTLLLWGDRDHALGTELIPGTADHVPDLTLRMLPGVSHWVQEEAPDQVSMAISGWMKSRNLA